MPIDARVLKRISKGRPAKNEILVPGTYRDENEKSNVRRYRILSAEQVGTVRYAACDN